MARSTNSQGPDPDVVKANLVDLAPYFVAAQTAADSRQWGVRGYEIGKIVALSALNTEAGQNFAGRAVAMAARAAAGQKGGDVYDAPVNLKTIVGLGSHTVVESLDAVTLGVLGEITGLENIPGNLANKTLADLAKGNKQERAAHDAAFGVYEAFAMNKYLAQALEGSYEAAKAGFDSIVNPPKKSK